MSRSTKSRNHSLTADVARLVALRQCLGWTQEVAGRKSGYSDRLIRKIEKQGAIRPQTLRDVLQCYHEALGVADWDFEDFVHREVADGPDSPAEDCENCERLKNYFTEVYCERNIEKIHTHCCPNIRLISEGARRIGIDAIHQRASSLLGAFNPIHFNFDKVHSIDRIVFLFWSVRMKHVGEFFEIPPSNKWVDLRGNSVAEFAEGRIVEAEDHFDVECIIRQITGQAPRVI